MGCYAQLKGKFSKKEKIATFVSQDPNPRTLVVSSRPLTISLLKHFKTDQDLVEGLGLLKTCSFINFDKIFVGASS